MKVRAIVGHWRGRPWQPPHEQPPLLQLQPHHVDAADAAAQVETLDPREDDADEVKDDGLVDADERKKSHDAAAAVAAVALAVLVVAAVAVDCFQRLSIL